MPSPAGVAFVAVNAEQAEDWNGVSGREFIEQRERHEQMLGSLRARLLAAARIQDGEEVLDIGCGCGNCGTVVAQHRAYRPERAAACGYHLHWRPWLHAQILLLSWGTTALGPEYYCDVQAAIGPGPHGEVGIVCAGDGRDDSQP